MPIPPGASSPGPGAGQANWGPTLGGETPLRGLGILKHPKLGPLDPRSQQACLWGAGAVSLGPLRAALWKPGPKQRADLPAPLQLLLRGRQLRRRQ